MKTLLRTHILLIALLGLCSGCTEERDLGRQEVVAHILSDPDNLHPTNGNSGVRSYIFEYMQGTLVRIDHESLEVVPFLVEEMPEVSEDKTQFTFQLRDDVTWPDGEPLTVEDVAFSMKVTKAPLTNNPYVRPVFALYKDVRPVPGMSGKFIIETEEPYMGTVSTLTVMYLLQKSKLDPEGVLDSFTVADMDEPDFTSREGTRYDRLKAWMNDFNSGEMGSDPAKMSGLGPYRVSNWDVGNAIVLERQQDWWGASDTGKYYAAYPPRIIFRIIRDNAASTLALQREELDVSTYLSTSSLKDLQQKDSFNSAYQSGFVDQFAYTYMGLNMRPDGIEHQPFFTDRKVRRAIAHLVPIDEIIKVQLEGEGTRQVSNVSPLNPAYDHTLPLIQVDVERAKELLTEAGWTDTDGDNIRDKEINGERVPFRFTLNYMSSPTSKETALMMKEVMYQAGVELEPNPMDFSAFFDAARAHDFDAVLGAWSGSALPEDYSQLWHTSSWEDKGLNFVGFGNAYTDSLIEASNVTLNPERRKELVAELQRVVYEEQPYVFLYSWPRKMAIHRRFQNGQFYNEKPGVILNNLRLNPAAGNVMVNTEN